MCDLVTGLMIAGTAIGAYGQVQAGNAAAAAANYQAQVATMNAGFAEKRAADALTRGKEEEERVRREGGQLMGQQTAQMAAAGLDLGFGSPLDVLIDTSTGIELDALRTRRNAALEAEDFDRQAWNYKADAGMSRAEGKNAKQAGRIGAVGTLLSGGAKAGQYRASIA